MQQFGVITKTRTLMDGVCEVRLHHCLEVVQATHNRLVVLCMLPVCPILIGVEGLGGLCQGIMGLHIFGCWSHAKHIQVVVNRLPLLKFDPTIWVLGQPGPQVVLEFTFIGEFKRLLEGHDLMVDCHGVWGEEGSIVDIEDKRDGPLDEETRVDLGLSESS